MATSLTSLRLFKFSKISWFLPKIVSDTCLMKIKAFENIFFVQNIRVFSNDEEYKSPHTFGTPEVVRRKTVPVPKILLLSQEGKVIEQVTLEEAQNLAKRRDLNLIQVMDVGFKTFLPTYQLMSKPQFLQEDTKAKKQKSLEKSTEIKASKIIIISPKIGKHDLEIKMKKIIKLLGKNHKVQIFISTDANKTEADAIVKSIDSGIAGSGKLQSKVAKPSGLKLYLEPVRKELTDENSQSKCQS